MTNPDLPVLPANDVLSVGALNRLARSLLEDCFPAVTVEGEISNLSMPGSGHWYLTLKDDDAQIRCAMFRNRNLRVRIRPANGMQVTVRGRLSLYEARGDYQLILESMEEAGAGALQKAFEQLKTRLRSEGLFSPERKRPLPLRCRHIGVITSPTGAVIRDILTVLQRRFPAMRITLFPVAVQGQHAAPSVVKALETANRRAAELSLDALIVARGGGSLEDLQAFNEEMVARAIAASELPVVSAVGHETDVTIADMVADVRAATPSAAAELLSPDQQVLEQQMMRLATRLQQQWQQRILQAHQSLHHLTRRLRHPGRRLQEQAQTVDLLESRLKRALLNRHASASHRLAQLRSRLLLCSPQARLAQQQQQRTTLAQRLRRAMRQVLTDHRRSLSQLSHTLEAVSPLQTLARGYSMTLDAEGMLVREAADVQPGDLIRTRLARSDLLSRIESIEPAPAQPAPDTATTP